MLAIVYIRDQITQLEGGCEFGFPVSLTIILQCWYLLIIKSFSKQFAVFLESRVQFIIKGYITYLLKMCQKNDAMRVNPSKMVAWQINNVW